MPTYPIQIKRSGTAASAPSSLAHGELALNYADKVLYFKDASNVIQSFTFQSYALASHTHSISDVTGLQTALDGKASSSHTHSISDVTGLQTALDGKAASSHTHSISDVTGLQTALDGKASSSHTHAASDITSGTLDIARIANDAVTYAKIQNVSATDRLLGRSSAGAGDVEEITCTSFGRSLIDDADAAAARTTLSVQPTASPSFTGTATFGGGQAVPIRITNDGAGSDVYARITNSDTGTTAGLLLGLNSNEEGVIRVEVNKPLYIDTNNTTRLTISSTGTATFAGQIIADDLATSNSVVYAFDGDTNTGIGRAGADILTVVTGGTERVRVDASGNVGIGTSPSYRLHASGNFSGASNIGLYVNNSGGTTNRIALQDTATTFTPNIGSVGNHITVDTVGTERLRIGDDGSLKAPDVYGDTVGATNRDLFIDNTGLIGYVSSIRESKTDIVTLDDVSWLSALSPVSYRYRKRNADGTYSDEADGVTDYGLIAEDVEAVKPELCFYDMVDGEAQLRGVTYSKLITPMLRYIQQLEARIAALEERING